VRQATASSAAPILPPVILLLILFFSSVASAAPQNAPATPDLSGARIVQDHGWPELQVDGKPFFVNGAAFDYFGVPQDLWAHSLDRYQEMGINTIDLTIPWNWHETADGEFDFDGHSNPRRDLRGLLRLIADRGFKLIVHAGPQMPATWRLAGYPEWLVSAPDYGMTAQQLGNGAEPPLAAEFHADADAAAASWLAREDFLRASQQWFFALARELSPYESTKKIVIDSPDTWGKTTPHEASGPLLLVVVGEGAGNGANGSADSRASVAPNLARYLSVLCAQLAAGGVDAPCLAQPDDLADPDLGSPAVSQDSGVVQSPMAGVAGQWIFSPRAAPTDFAAPAGETLGARDAENLALLADTLERQSSVPPLITAFHASGYAAPYEDSPARVAVSATTVGTRLLLGRGIGGIVYAPFEDSLTPAGYETPGTNRYLNRDTALDIEGNPRAQAAAIERNGGLVKAWGERLASVHLRADLGVIDLRAEIAGAAEENSGAGLNVTSVGDQQSGWPAQAQRALEQVLLVADLAGRTAEVVDPATQTVERLLRDPVLALIAPKMDSGEPHILPERARRALLEYVRRGGILIAESSGSAPPGLAALWSDPGNPLIMAGSRDAIRRGYGDGATIEWAQDFYSWVDPSESLAESRGRSEADWAAKDLSRLLENAGASPVIRRSDATPQNDALVLSELVGNEGGGSLGTQSVRCTARPLCAVGLLSATNLDSSQAQQADLEISIPSEGGSHGSQGALHVLVAVPPGESLLLPLHAPLCSEGRAEKPCTDEIVTAGAELLGAEREKNVLELTFYAPMSAKVVLRLEKQPTKVELDDNSVDGQWSEVVRTFEVNVLRGAAPDYSRVVKIYLPYTPHVAEKADSPKHPPSAFDVTILSAVHLPIGQGPSIGSVPPLILVPTEEGKEQKDQRLVLRTDNRGDGGVEFEAHILGPFAGADSVRVDSGVTLFSDIKAVTDPQAPPVWPPDGRISEELQLDKGKQHLKFPLIFQNAGSDGFLHYAYDFERDGSLERVLENSALQLFLSPRDGGRMLALVSKSTGENFITTVGALRDWFLVGGDSEPRDFTFNRAYSAEWTDASVPGPAAIPRSAADASAAAAADTSIGVRMRYDAPEAGPAGAVIEKSVRLIAPATVEARYRVSLNAGSGLSSATPSLQFVAVSSLPAGSGEDRATQFCWIAPAAQSGGGAPAEPVGGSHDSCVSFVPLGAPLAAPSGVTRLEVHTPGHAELDFEWTAGALTVEMKSDSVLLEVAVPLSADLPAETALRYTVGPVQ
jgi:hypothetical protein